MTPNPLEQDRADYPVFVILSTSSPALEEARKSESAARRRFDDAFRAMNHEKSFGLAMADVMDGKPATEFRWPEPTLTLMDDGIEQKLAVVQFGCPVVLVNQGGRKARVLVRGLTGGDGDRWYVISPSSAVELTMPFSRYSYFIQAEPKMEGPGLLFVESPHFRRCGPDGAFVLEGVPVGAQKLRIFSDYPYFDYRTGKRNREAVELRVSPGENVLPPIELKD